MYKKDITLRVTNLVLLASSPFLHTYVQAQESSDTRVDVLEEIFVTARKRQETIQDTPISVQAFSPETLQQIGAHEVDHIADYTPNLQISKVSGSQDNLGYSIRGIGSNEPALAVEPTVGLYIDGVYIGRSTGAAFDLVDLERVEILRGPQGTLYGRNTIGGAISVVTKRPMGEFIFNQLLSTGNQNYFRSSTSIDTPTWNNVSAKLTYNTTAKDGDAKSMHTGERLGDFESDAFRLALQWIAMDDLYINYNYDISRRDSNVGTSYITNVSSVHQAIGGPIFQQATAASSLDKGNSVPSFYTRGKLGTSSDIDGHSVTFEWEKDNYTAKSITAYREWESHSDSNDFGSFPADGTNVLQYDAAFNLVPLPVGEMVSLFDAVRDSDQHQFSQEFQLVGDLFDEDLTYNVGIYYFTESASEDNPQVFVLPASFLMGQTEAGYQAQGAAPGYGSHVSCGGDPMDFAPFTIPWDAVTGGQLSPLCLGKDVKLGAPIFKYSVHNESIALYGQFTYSTTDSLDITLGLRYTQDDKEATLLQGNIDPNTKLKDKESWSNFNPGLTVDYTWNENIKTYAKVTTGYRAGGYNARASSATAFSNPVDEENLISYELGIRSDWFENTLRFNLTAFYLDYTDRQVEQFEAGSGGASQIIVNAGESSTDGLELELTWMPITGLTTQLLWGYTHMEYNEFTSSVQNPATSQNATSIDEAEMVLEHDIPKTDYATNPCINPVAGIPDAENGSCTRQDPIITDISSIASPILNAPRHSGVLVLQYEFAPTQYGIWTVRLDGTYSTERSFSAVTGQNSFTDEHFLTNARITLAAIPAGDYGQFMLSAWGRNLEDKEVKSFGIDWGALGFESNDYIDPRSYGIDLSYRY